MNYKSIKGIDQFNEGNNISNCRVWLQLAHANEIQMMMVDPKWLPPKPQAAISILTPFSAGRGSQSTIQNSRPLFQVRYSFFMPTVILAASGILFTPKSWSTLKKIFNVLLCLQNFKERRFINFKNSVYISLSLSLYIFLS